MVNKIKPHNRCQDCNKYISGLNSKSGKCRECLSLHLAIEYGNNKIISDFSAASRRHQYQGIRSHARRLIKCWGWKKQCSICEWDLMVELCHYRSISDFPVDTPLSVVNNKKNLLYACPNCHWELDHPHKEDPKKYVFSCQR